MGQIAWNPYRVFSSVVLFLFSICFSSSYAGGSWGAPSGYVPENSTRSKCNNYPYNSGTQATNCSNYVNSLKSMNPDRGWGNYSFTYAGTSNMGNCYAGSVTMVNDGAGCSDSTPTACKTGKYYDENSGACVPIQCTPPAVYQLSTNSCVNPNPCADNTDSQRLVFESGTDTNGNGVVDPNEPGGDSTAPSTMSVDGCGYALANPGNFECWKEPPSNIIYCEADFVGTGNQLAPDSTNTPSQGTGECPAGQSPLTIGGKTYCFENQTTESTTTSTNDGVGGVNTNEATTTSTLNPTTGTVTSTTTNSDGSSTSTTTGFESYCRENPTAAICSPTSTVGSGSQPADGDFINPGDGGEVDTPTVGQAGSINWHTVFFAESGACALTVIPLSIMGRTIEFDLSVVCPYLDLIKAVVIMLAVFASIRMFVLAPW